MMFKFRSAALACVFLCALGICVDLVDAAVSCPPPNENAADWVDCVGGFVKDSPCILNGGSCDASGNCIIGGSNTGVSCTEIATGVSCQTPGNICDNFGNCITGGTLTTTSSHACVTCKDACNGDCCDPNPNIPSDDPCSRATACIKKDTSCSGSEACVNLAEGQGQVGKPIISGPSCVGYQSCFYLGSSAAATAFDIPDYVTASCVGVAACKNLGRLFSIPATINVGISPSFGNLLASCNGRRPCIDLCSDNLCPSGSSSGSLNGSCNGGNRLCFLPPITTEQVCSAGATGTPAPTTQDCFVDTTVSPLPLTPDGTCDAFGNCVLNPTVIFEESLEVVEYFGNAENDIKEASDEAEQGNPGGAIAAMARGAESFKFARTPVSQGATCALNFVAGNIIQVTNAYTADSNIVDELDASGALLDTKTRLKIAMDETILEEPIAEEEDGEEGIGEGIFVKGGDRRRRVKKTSSSASKTKAKSTSTSTSILTPEDIQEAIDEIEDAIEDFNKGKKADAIRELTKAADVLNCYKGPGLEQPRQALCDLIFGAIVAVTKEMLIA